MQRPNLVPWWKEIAPAKLVVPRDSFRTMKNGTSDGESVTATDALALLQRTTNEANARRMLWELSKKRYRRIHLRAFNLSLTR